MRERDSVGIEKTRSLRRRRREREPEPETERKLN